MEIKDNLTAECSFSQTQGKNNASSKTDSKSKSYRFRVTSADSVIGEGAYNCTEFPADVLRAAVDKFNNVKVLFAANDSYEHRKTLSDIVGITSNAAFVEATSDVPAGIEVDIIIPENLAPNVIEMLEMRAIDACSSSTRFVYTESHSRAVDTYYYYGDLMPDGTFFRRIATEVMNVLEISFVFEGADKYSKLIDITSGKPINVTSHSKEKANTEEENVEVVDTTKTTIISSLQFSAEQLSALCDAAGTNDFELMLDKLNYAVTQRKERVAYILKVRKLANPNIDYSVLEKTLLNAKEDFVDFSYKETSTTLPTTCVKCGGNVSIRTSVDDTDYNNNVSQIKRQPITL